ncbi:MAG: hypothetical protein ACI89E_000565 [Planctomycetota bacterium]|jgi:hypothetical protein
MLFAVLHKSEASAVQEVQSRIGKVLQVRMSEYSRKDCITLVQNDQGWRLLVAQGLWQGGSYAGGPTLLNPFDFSQGPWWSRRYSRRLRNSRYQSNVTRNPSVKLLVVAGLLSRNQAWKYQVCPARMGWLGSVGTWIRPI